MVKQVKTRKINKTSNNEKTNEKVSSKKGRTTIFDGIPFPGDVKKKSTSVKKIKRAKIRNNSVFDERDEEEIRKALKKTIINKKSDKAIEKEAEAEDNMSIAMLIMVIAICVLVGIALAICLYKIALAGA